MSSTLPLFCPDSTYITTAMENQKATSKETREKYSLDPSKYLGKVTAAVPTTQRGNFSVGGYTQATLPLLTIQSALHGRKHLLRPFQTVPTKRPEKGMASGIP